MYILILEINECKVRNPDLRHDCRDICINTEGSFRCDCRKGFELQPDGKTCSGSNRNRHLTV